MSERQQYYDRRAKALRVPNKYLSTIGDGMAQLHNMLPHLGASGSTLCPQFDTHLQGIIVHGKRFTVYRHFENVPKGTNVALHAWLSELYKEYLDRNKRLPEELFHQMDGGNENANAVTIAMAELLVHRGLTTKITLTRLPAGHTHEGTLVWSCLLVDIIGMPTKPVLSSLFVSYFSFYAQISTVDSQCCGCTIV
jgi:hypothetical protein